MTKPPAPFLIILLLSLVMAAPLGGLPGYWEAPALFSPAPGSFPVSAFGGGLSLLAWQEAEAAAGGFLIRPRLGIKSPEGPWRFLPFPGGPYFYAGEEPALLSAAVDSRGRILIAAAASPTRTEVFISGDRGETFRCYPVENGFEAAAPPLVTFAADGGCILFISRGPDLPGLYYTRSPEGRSWPPLKALGEGGGASPGHAVFGSTDYVVFQAPEPGGVQLFLVSSPDGGGTWTGPRRITGFRDPVAPELPPESFDNRHPHLSCQDEGLFLVWERHPPGLPPRIYGAALDGDGALRSPAERINREEARCAGPQAIHREEETLVLWVDQRRGNNRVYVARRGDRDWQNYELSGSGGDARRVRPLIDGTRLLIFWQDFSGGTSRIYRREPDTTVDSPHLRPDNFVPGRRSRGDRVRLSWTLPPDASGIFGVSYLWSQDPAALPSPQILAYPGVTGVEEIALDDGEWYFNIMAQDFAGNWSAPARLRYLRDTTPPPAVSPIPPPLDPAGYLRDNSFSLRWDPPPVPDIAGYTWNLEYLGPREFYEGLDDEAFRAAAEARSPPPPALPPRIRGTLPAASYTNQDDGVWRFSVAAVDEVGNRGPPVSVFLRTNKYIPHTALTYVDASQDASGIPSLRLIGRGFTGGGRVERIFLDRDGWPPYDGEYFLARGDYRVLSDREITGLRVGDLTGGPYTLGLEHPLRGLSVSAPLVTLDDRGTVKFGDFSQAWTPSWAPRQERRLILDVVVLVLAGICLLCGAGAFAAARGLGGLIGESAAIRMEAAALMTGDFMPMEKKKQLRNIRRRRIGLGVKLSAFTITLVLLVVALVSIPLGLMMSRTQEETLLRGLWERSGLLLESLASQAREPLAAADQGELASLPGWTGALPEARYITITGFGPDSAVFDDRVWATNDPEILAKIDTARLLPGVSRLEDPLSPQREALFRDLNEAALAEVADLSAGIANLDGEARALELGGGSAGTSRLEDLRASLDSLGTRVSEELSQVGRGIGSVPDFPLSGAPEAENRRYLLFKPILYRQGTEDVYFRGLIRLEVSTESIREGLILGWRNLLRVIALVSLTAIAIAALGALVLSGLITRPIQKLVNHVELIRDTEDKSKLEGVDILLKSRDELAVLGSTINDMTHSLVRAAHASHDLTIGKEVQKKFIPLEIDQDGNKLTSGFKDTPNAQFFGYYEGAKGVSGDYFDYLDLDGRYFAIIKCDVAGKGVPAALIMIQVATMFLNHFKNWQPTPRGMHIEEVVYQINDFIEALGFKGRFAAFTLCLFDTWTGLVRFCNAGDNIIHYFDASEGKMKTLTLRESPAAGILPNVLVESKGGYTVEPVTIDPGDILFLYTDGIDEAKRKFRDAQFREIRCTEGGITGLPHGNHLAGQEDEELGADRVEAIINAVMNRERYNLYKYHNPEGEITLPFDFTGCRGTVEEAIMALISVEKIFRLYKDPAAREGSRVLVDKKVDAFLGEHFLRYRMYCGNSRPYPENETYMYYTHVKEDAQYDDLTIIGIKRKEEFA